MPTLRRVSYPCAYLIVDTNFHLAISEHAAQLDSEDKSKLETILKELRELAVKGQAGDTSVSSEGIKEVMDKAQTASLSLFQKVYEKKNEETKSSDGGSTPEAEVVDEKPKKD